MLKFFELAMDNWLNSEAGRYRAMAYRRRSPDHKLHFADENTRAFHDCLQLLKNDDNMAVDLFANLLAMLFDSSIGCHDTIACVPRSLKTRSQKPHSNARVAMKASKLLHIQDGSMLLRRVRDVPPSHQDSYGSHNTVEAHLDSLKVFKDSIGKAPGSILLIDDVHATGKQKAASIIAMRKAFPDAEVNAFSFGLAITSVNRGDVPTSCMFPRELTRNSVEECLQEWSQNAFPYRLCRNNRTVHGEYCNHFRDDLDPVCSIREVAEEGLVECGWCRPLVYGRLLANRGNKVHLASCQSAPSLNDSKPVWNIPYAKRMGYKPCGNCLKYLWGY